MTIGSGGVTTGFDAETRGGIDELGEKAASGTEPELLEESVMTSWGTTRRSRRRERKGRNQAGLVIPFAVLLLGAMAHNFGQQSK